MKLPSDPLLRLLSPSLVCGLLCLPVALRKASAAAEAPMLVYIGTYSGAKSKGIYVSRFDGATGRLSPPELAAETKNPSFLAVHPDRPFLYAVGETSDFAGKKTGAVSAFRIEAKSGQLTLLNQQTSGGTGPCHLAVDKTGRCVLVAIYGSGSVAALPLEPDGRLAEPGMLVQHEGSSVNKQRQEGPHAHFITNDPGNRFALACDLGLDKVLVYRLNPFQKPFLTPNDPPSASIRPGSGPRHLAFHPTGRWVYVINEMGSTITALAYDAMRGTLQELQTVSTLPEGFTGENYCAEVQVHPSGKFVYGSNRRHDSIVVFGIDPKTRKLTLVEHQPTKGKTPRHFAIAPTGNWLLVENQDSDNIAVFRVDRRTGRLTPTGQEVEVGAPVCMAFVR